MGHIEGLVSGDHACAIYSDDSEWWHLLSAFLHAGFDRGEKCIYILSSNTAVEVQKYLFEEGLDVRSFLENGQLEITDAKSIYLRKTPFDPDAVIALLAEETEKTLSEGYSALRVTGEMDWMSAECAAGSKVFMEYEAKVNRLFWDSKCVALCQYDRRLFDPEFLLGVLSAHPKVVIDGESYDNIYYVPPDEFLYETYPDTLLDRRIRMLAERKRAEEALRASEERVKKKLKVILEPEGDLSALELSDIVDGDALQSLMDDFYKLTNIGVAVVDLKGELVVATGWQDICTQFHRVHPETRKYCIESDTELSAGVEPGTYKVYRCRNNMWDMATPIMVGEKHIGNLFLGQFFFDDETPDYDLFREQARRYGFDEDAYIAALDRVPRWSRKTIGAVMGFYSHLAEMTSSLSHSRITLARALYQKDSLLEELGKREEQLRDFMDIASHELRHPATLLKGYALTLGKHGNTTDEALRKAALDAIDKGTDRLVMVVEELLDVSRIERDRFRLAMENVDIVPLMNRAMEEIAAKNRGNDFVMEVADDIGYTSVDPERMVRLLVILLDNAAKYSPQGSRVELTASREGDNILFSVLDRGIGVPPESREEVFERFWQVEDAKYHSSSGLGLGLYIGRNIVEAHGGKIWHEPREGGGSVFRFSLPAV